jgi:transposase InsO family protein
LPAKTEVQDYDGLLACLPVAENLLDQKFEASAPNQIWLSNISYILMGEGWLYLASHKDLFTGEFVGYAIAERMTKNMVSQSLLRAIAAKRLSNNIRYLYKKISNHLTYYHGLTFIRSLTNDKKK